MIDESLFEAQREAQKEGQKPEKTSPVPHLHTLTKLELVTLRDEIHQLLPDSRAMDLHRELSEQYHTLKEFQLDYLSEENIDPSRVATIMNATTTTLGQLIKLQESLDRAEQMKKLESCMIEAVALLPAEAKDRFFHEYEALALNYGLTKDE